jgi:hypothetical protein
MRDVLSYALRTAELIGPVFPLAPKSKDPFGKLAPHGVYSATRDPAVIRSWFRPCSSLGLAVSFGGGLLLLDVDPRDNGDETIERWQLEHGDLPHTVRAITGRRDGGLHYILRCPVDLDFKNGRIGPGVDVKGDGGYGAVAPTVHPDTGHPYIWDPRALPSTTPIAEAPAWLLDMLRERCRVDYGEATGKAAESFVGCAFRAASMIGKSLGDDAVCVLCPWYEEHSDGRGKGHDSSTVVLAPTSKAPLGSFCCVHGHCDGRRTGDALAKLPKGAIDAATEALPDLAEQVARWLDERGEAAE